MSLAPCPSCSRHIRETDPSCPFCGDGRQRRATNDALPARAPSRAGIMLGLRVGAVAVSAVLFGSACSTYGAPPGPPRDAGHDGGPPDAAQTP